MLPEWFLHIYSWQHLQSLRFFFPLFVFSNIGYFFLLPALSRGGFGHFFSSWKRKCDRDPGKKKKKKSANKWEITQKERSCVQLPSNPRETHSPACGSVREAMDRQFWQRSLNKKKTPTRDWCVFPLTQPRVLALIWTARKKQTKNKEDSENLDTRFTRKTSLL